MTASEMLVSCMPICAGGRVLDLGCVPGAWLQVACSELGPKGGLILGIDIQKVGRFAWDADLALALTQSADLSLQTLHNCPSCSFC